MATTYYQENGGVIYSVTDDGTGHFYLGVGWLAFDTKGDAQAHWPDAVFDDEQIGLLK